jgi:hypothetical protein
MRITGNTYTAEVSNAQRLKTDSCSKSALTCASELGDAYSVIAVDAGPVAAEYTLYFKNNSADEFHLYDMWSYGTDADVVWKLHKVTGTASGTAITPVNLNVGSGKIADVTVAGGAAGVTGLTSAGVLLQWYNGIANTTNKWTIDGAIIIPSGTAIAIEYDAGTGGAAMLTLRGYYESHQ